MAPADPPMMLQRSARPGQPCLGWRFASGRGAARADLGHVATLVMSRRVGALPRNEGETKIEGESLKGRQKVRFLRRGGEWFLGARCKGGG